jgi:pimeloyl-ACP methyl ester carboxylesterase
MLYNGFHFHRTSLARFFMLFPLRPLTLLSTYRSPVEHLTYWYRPHSSKTRLPVLFIHGIGIGLYPYTNFLRDLKAVGRDDTEVGIIALEIMPVSSRITHPALEKDVMVSEVQAIIKHHGWSRFILVSHSYGSIISTHLLKSPLTVPLIGPVVLIDPVSFLLHLPDVAYNFTARQPVRANEYQLWYFGSKDMGVAHSLARSFFWSQNIIWKEDLGVVGANEEEGRDVTVVLSGRDLIVDTEAVRRYLTTSPSEGAMPNGEAVYITNRNGKARTTKIGNKDIGRPWTSGRWMRSGLEVLWFEHLDHAQVFDREETRRPIVKAIESYSAKGGIALTLPDLQF